VFVVDACISMHLLQICISASQCTNKYAKKAFKEFSLKLCGTKKCQNESDPSFYRKRSAIQTDVAIKKHRTEEMEMDSPPSNSRAITASSSSTAVNAEGVKPDTFTTNKNLTYTLPDSWRTVEIHDRGIDGKGVTIAFLDSGINIMHKSVAGRIKAVIDVTCAGDIDLTTDHYGHGTMCASIACGKPFKPLGSSTPVHAGVAPEANIVMYKITNYTGKADSDVITKGLQMCLNDKERYGIDIVMLPFGSKNYNPYQGTVIRDLINNGVLVVTASGNYGLRTDVPYPARLGYTICVGAQNKHGKVTPCSCEGDAVDFLAPGEDITAASSKHPTAFGVGGGTSCAAACVAGLLALIIQHGRSAATSSIKQLQDVPIKVEELVHNQDVIKKVLRDVSKFPTHRQYSCGHGGLTPMTILENNKILEYLYKDIYFKASSK